MFSPIWLRFMKPSVKWWALNAAGCGDLTWLCEFSALSTKTTTLEAAPTYTLPLIGVSYVRVKLSGCTHRSVGTSVRIRLVLRNLMI